MPAWSRAKNGSSPHTRGARTRGPPPRKSSGIIPAYAGSTAWPWSWPGPWPDHPRIRGEHRNASSRASRAAGSSPHTRGAPDKPHGPARGSGIIPAYAGSTWIIVTRQAPARDHPRIRGEHDHSRFPLFPRVGSSPHTRGARGGPGGAGPSRPDHPRIRGEHLKFMPVRAIASGSSPHTRGAPVGVPVQGATGRIIPAYAGSTEASRVGAGRPGDHPRIRGEHERRIGAFIGAVGSSPHTRGAHSRSDPLGGTRGIIPAYAGSTTGPCSSRTSPWDHPRIRGEHRSPVVEHQVTRGSSPHTRGARWRGPGRRSPGRIIPAYAGSTIEDLEREDLLEDHPRIRGEHVPVQGELRDRAGSSPHTRGAPRVVRVPGPDPGIIPAYAGSTRRPASATECVPDHPRIRGEHVDYEYLTTYYDGSSPHTRGAPLESCERISPRGIIPAYAGSTGSPSPPPLESWDHPRIRGEHCQAILHVSSLAGSSPHTRGAPSSRPRSARQSRIIPAYAGSTTP